MIPVCVFVQGHNDFGRLGDQCVVAVAFPHSHGALAYGLHGWGQRRTCGVPVPMTEELYIDTCTRNDPGGPGRSQGLV